MLRKLIFIFLILLLILTPVTAEKEPLEITASLIYYINLDGSADATITLRYHNVNENDLKLDYVWFGVNEVATNITDIKVFTPGRKPLNRRIFSSGEECLENIKPLEYCYFVNTSSESEEEIESFTHIFIIATNTILEPDTGADIAVSYTIENITRYSIVDSKVAHIPGKGFDAFKAIIIENGREEEISLKSKEYNILVNLPQDHYHYSILKAAPSPYPDTFSRSGNAHTLSWNFEQIGNSTTPIWIYYNILEDPLKQELDKATMQSVKDGRRSLIISILAIIIAIGLGLWSNKVSGDANRRVTALANSQIDEKLAVMAGHLEDSKLNLSGINKVLIEDEDVEEFIEGFSLNPYRQIKSDFNAVTDLKKYASDTKKEALIKHYIIPILKNLYSTKKTIENAPINKETFKEFDRFSSEYNDILAKIKESALKYNIETEEIEKLR